MKSYEDAPFRKLADPLDRVFGRLDFVKASVGGDHHVTKGCLIGMFAQELAVTNPEIGERLPKLFLSAWSAIFPMTSRKRRPNMRPTAKFDPKGVAQLYLSIVQGSLMLAKIAGNNDVLHENIEQFRTHLKFLFGIGPARNPPPSLPTKPGNKSK